jgi:CRISPR/Cas system-associated protein Cas5 (RAMP superfamily)
MGVRNCAELGKNIQKIVKRLIANDDLVKLLYYEGDDPLERSPLSVEEKNKEVFEKLIKTVPRVGTKDTAKSVVVVYV